MDEEFPYGGLEGVGVACHRVKGDLLFDLGRLDRVLVVEDEDPLLLGVLLFGQKLPVSAL